jgi:hypothetical protein
VLPRAVTAEPEPLDGEPAFGEPLYGEPPYGEPLDSEPAPGDRPARAGRARRRDGTWAAVTDDGTDADHNG